MNIVSGELPNLSLSKLFQSFQSNVKKGLLREIFSGYSFMAVAKSIAGRENPSYLLATRHAPSVFFYVVAFVHLSFAALFRAESMVAQAGLTSVRPVSNKAGILTPVWATTNHERENSGGSNNQYLLEVALWLLPLMTAIRYLPIFSWVFAAPIFVLPLAAFKSPHHLNSLHAVSWLKILSLPSLAAYLLYIRRRTHEQ